MSYYRPEFDRARPNHSFARHHHRADASKKTPELTDDRYAELLKQASNLFRENDVNFEVEREFAIKEIKAAMFVYGLSLDELEKHIKGSE